MIVLLRLRFVYLSFRFYLYNPYTATRGETVESSVHTENVPE